MHIGKCKRSVDYDGSSWNNCSSGLFLLNPEPDIGQQYIGIGNHYRTFCATKDFQCDDDLECDTVNYRIFDMWKGIWGEDSIYKYFAAALSGSF